MRGERAARQWSPGFRFRYIRATETQVLPPRLCGGQEPWKGRTLSSHRSERAHGMATKPRASTSASSGLRSQGLTPVSWRNEANGHHARVRLGGTKPTGTNRCIDRTNPPTIYCPWVPALRAQPPDQVRGRARPGHERLRRPQRRPFWPKRSQRKNRRCIQRSGRGSIRNASSPMPKFRRPLLDESGHSFLLVLASRTGRGRRAARSARPRRSEVSKLRLTASFAAMHGGQRHRGDGLGRLHRLVHEARRRHHARDQAGASRPRRHPSCVRSESGPWPWPCRPARVSRCVPPMPGMTPSLISGWPNLALSAAMMKSHIIASSQPPPSAKPATAAMIGLRTRAQPLLVGGVVGAENVDIGLVRHLLDVGAGREGLVRSGEQDAADVGVGIEGLHRRQQLARSAALSAFNACGRLSRTMPTRPRVSTTMVSACSWPRSLCAGLSAFDSSGQKKVERPVCTMRLIVPAQPGVGHGFPSRS